MFLLRQTVLILAAAGCVGVVPARARTLEAGVPTGERTVAPRGFTAMCRERPQFCGVQPAAAPIGPADDRARLRLAQRVNASVNRALLPASDQALYGRRELWTAPDLSRPGAQGDCEDYAVRKRVTLEAAGFPAADLFYAVVYRRDLGLHTVLVARVSGRDYVLDSLEARVLPWRRAPYTWVKRQSERDPAVWTFVAVTPASRLG